jgi:hypothetical protein
LNKYFDKFKIENGPTIKYKFNNKEKIYFPDFYLPELNLIIEIKNSYLFKKNYEIINIKELYVKNKGYNYILILDKNYNEFKSIYGI